MLFCRSSPSPASSPSSLCCFLWLCLMPGPWWIRLLHIPCLMLNNPSYEKTRPSLGQHGSILPEVHEIRPHSSRVHTFSVFNLGCNMKYKRWKAQSNFSACYVHSKACSWRHIVQLNQALDFILQMSEFI